MKKLIILLLIVLLLILKGIVYSERIMELPELLNPTSVTMDDNRIYFADRTSVVVYSLDKSRFIYKFGKEGDGPGEFKIVPNMPMTVHLRNANLVISNFGKVSIYTKAGIFKNEIRNKSIAVNLIPCNNLYVGRGFSQSEGQLYFTINIYNEELNKIKEIYREKSSFQRGTNQKFDPIDATGPGIAVASNHLFLNIGDNRNTIAAFDLKGKKLFAFTHNFREIKLTKAHIKRYMEYLETDPNFRDFVARTKHLFKFKELFPLVQNLIIDEGKIFVTSYENDHGTRDLYVFTLNGEFIKQMEVPLVSQNVDAPYPFTIHKGKIYQIFENEDDDGWELFSYDIDMSNP